MVSYFLFVCGLAWTIAILKPGRFIREPLKKIPVIGKLVCCPVCLSFWLGILASFFLFPSLSAPYLQKWVPHYVAPIVDGFGALFVSYIIYVFTEKAASGLDL